VIVDASVLVAAANDSDPDAIPCRQLLQTANGPLIVAIAERTGTITIASLDNHFRIVKPRHGTAFEVRP
jgi:predicted nucleic acid-binding protein